MKELNIYTGRYNDITTEYLPYVNTYRVLHYFFKGYSIYITGCKSWKL